MHKQQYNQSTFWQLRRLYGMLQLPQIQSICVFATKDISLCSVLDLQVSALQRLACHCKATRFHRWSGGCPLLKTYQLSGNWGNCFSVHDSLLFPGHDHSAADNSKPAMAVFKSRSIVWQFWRPAFQPWQSQRLDEPERGAYTLYQICNGICNWEALINPHQDKPYLHLFAFISLH